MTAVSTVFPRACIQFEDFAFGHAAPILARYRDRICCFNDDIQGTASVALAGLVAALKIVGGSLGEQRFLFLGGGTAAAGIAGLLVKAMRMDGIAEDNARKRCWMFDVNGLIQSRRKSLADFRSPSRTSKAVCPRRVVEPAGASAWCGIPPKPRPIQKWRTQLRWLQ